MTADFGQQFGLDLETDSSTAKGVSMRRRVTNHEIRVWKIKDTENKLVLKATAG